MITPITKTHKTPPRREPLFLVEPLNRFIKTTVFSKVAPADIDVFRTTYDSNDQLFLYYEARYLIDSAIALNVSNSEFTRYPRDGKKIQTSNRQYFEW